MNKGKRIGLFSENMIPLKSLGLLFNGIRISPLVSHISGCEHLNERNNIVS